MNPYLEQEDAWRDFHERVLPHAAEALSPQVSPAYVVKLEQNLYIHDVESESYLEIRDRKTRRLVTVVELLSPTNKRPGDDRQRYVAKRAGLLRSEAHFVELDLLRGWPRMPFDEPPGGDYCVLVSRVEDRPRADFWPIGLREQLPVIPIPLQKTHPDARLDLQSLLHRVYDAAYYRDYIYDGSPWPPLSEDDAAWARQTAAGEAG
jgi:hypothetical protein